MTVCMLVCRAPASLASVCCVCRCLYVTAMAQVCRCVRPLSFATSPILPPPPAGPLLHTPGSESGSAQAAAASRAAEASEAARPVRSVAQGPQQQPLLSLLLRYCVHTGRHVTEGTAAWLHCHHPHTTVAKGGEQDSRPSEIKLC